MIDRTLIPITQIPSSLPEFAFQTTTLSNGIRVHTAQKEEELHRISFYFECGTLYESQSGTVSSLAKLLLSGSKKHNSFTIQERLDYYGAYTDIDSTYKYINFTVFCLKEHVESILDFLSEVLLEVEIPENEFQLHVNKSLESLKVNEQKTSFLAQKLFRESLYGTESPYGKTLASQDYLDLNVDQIQSYYQTNFLNSLQEVQVNTPLSANSLSILERFPRGTTKTIRNTSIPEGGTKMIKHHFPDAVQASLYLGMPCLTRHDENYPDWSLLVTLFGGYFGSRLMKNIREDKGYTYGIGSGTHHLPDRAFLSIRSDVKNEAKEACIDEIFKEIDRLKTNYISEEELLTVKNYMLGSLQRSFDGSLALGDRYHTLLEHKLPINYYHTYNERILNLTIEDIYSIANKHLNANNLHVVVVGHFES